MPLYEYDCESHGVFEAMVRMSESSAPSACPHCSEPAARILSRVRAAQLSRSQLLARDRNELSRHEPRVVTTETTAAGRARAPDERPRWERSHGSRPWALEHGG